MFNIYFSSFTTIGTLEVIRWHRLAPTLVAKVVVHYISMGPIQEVPVRAQPIRVS
jgi:hypothetical protein